MAVSALFSDFNNKININCFYVFQIVTQTYLCGRIVSQEIIRNYGKNYVRKIIKLSLFILFCVVQIHPLFAVDACVEDDVVPIIERVNWNWAEIDQGKYVPPSGNGSIIWKISKDDTFLKGTSACLSNDHGVAQFDIYTDNNGVLIDNGKVVVGGERNGKACWCKITYPIVSLWGMRDNSYWSSLNSCAANCAYWCLWEEIGKALIQSVTN